MSPSGSVTTIVVLNSYPIGTSFSAHSGFSVITGLWFPTRAVLETMEMMKGESLTVVGYSLMLYR